MRYDRYDSMTLAMPRKARAAGLPFKKNAYPTAIVHQLDYRTSQNRLFGEMMDDYIMAEEDYWLHSTKSNVLFPESMTLMERLMEGEYHIEDPDAFDLPFSSFVLPMPLGFKIDGVTIPTALVTWIKGKNHISTVVDTFLNRYHRPASRIHIMEENIGKSLLSIVIPTRDGQYSRVMCYHDLIPKLFSAKTVNDFGHIVGKLSDETIAADLDPYDAKQQFYLLKLVTALGVYTTACGPKNVITAGYHNVRDRATALPKEMKAPTTCHTLRLIEAAQSLSVNGDHQLVIEQSSAIKEKSAGADQWMVRQRSVMMPTDFSRD